jgi:LysR family transcriptional activator of glutamate synthase operon
LEDEAKMIATEVVFHEHGCAVLPPGHPFIGREMVRLEELMDYPLVISPKGAGVRNNMDIIFAKFGYTPKIVCEANDMDLLLNAVMGGLGYAFMPRRLMYQPQWKPYCVNVDVGNVTVEIGISYNRSAVSDKLREVFLSFLKEFFSTVEQ